MPKTTKSSRSRLVHNIFFVEDHPVFREGLMQILNAEPDLKVCGTAENVPEALKAIARFKPDLVLVDIRLPGKSGLELIKRLRATNRTIKLLVVSIHDEALYADRVLRAGGDGYIMKQEDPEEILNAIRDVLGGHIYVSEGVLKSGVNGSARKISPRARRPLADLTDSELELLELFGHGKTNEEIAKTLSLNLRSIIDQSAQLKSKLKLKTDNALVRYAVCWVEQGEL